jgi:hypothetical protein
MDRVGVIADTVCAHPTTERQDMSYNPNRGKRKASPATRRDRPRLTLTSNPDAARHDTRIGTTGVTVTLADPAYLKRYGAAAAIAHAERGGSRAVTVARNVRNRAKLRSI